MMHVILCWQLLWQIVIELNRWIPSRKVRSESMKLSQEAPIFLLWCAFGPWISCNNEFLNAFHSFFRTSSRKPLPPLAARVSHVRICCIGQRMLVRQRSILDEVFQGWSAQVRIAHWRSLALLYYSKTPWGTFRDIALFHVDNYISSISCFVFAFEHAQIHV